VRELENIIKRAVVTTIGKTLKVDFTHVSAPLTENNGPVSDEVKEHPLAEAGSFEELLESMTEAMLERMLALPDADPLRTDLMGKLEKLLILKTLDKLKGNQVQTAKLLGITRNTLRSRIEQYGATA
jgi:DNA-binding NtrC family response regulator